ncbi:hypothetical protein ACRALDRAFT_2024718 [Sodiomyces alcalophilus JCM 7366]|uniref:uncharacterized protein n=1 Tax=Sodiomyces alcalophilus JCM 7366 TaxID=591952 RepID=UPI0039B3FF7E
MAESRAGWGRLRQLKINKLLSLVKVTPTTVTQDEEGTFRIIHAPDRPDYPAPAAAAPTDEECISFLEAFRSPKTFGRDDGEKEEDPNEVTGANMAEWRPYPPLKDFPRSPQTARSNVQGAEQTKLATTISPVKESQQQLHATIPDGKCWADTEQLNESVHDNQAGVVTTLEDAQTRLQMLASHRRAARWSDQSQDSGYEELPWCRGSHDARPEVTIPTHQPQSSQSTTESRSRWSLSPDGTNEHWSPLAMKCRQAGDDDDDNNSDPDDLPREEWSEKIDHIAHNILPTTKHEMAAHSPSAPALPPSYTPWRQPEPTQSLTESVGNERRRITSRFQDWQTPEQREEFERNIEVYGDWAEYYFQTENFEETRHDEKRKQRGSPREATIPDSHTAGSLETVWEDTGPDTPNTLDSPWSVAADPKPWTAERGTRRGCYFGNDGFDVVRVHEEQSRLPSPWKPPPYVRPLRSDVFYDVVRDAILNKPLPVNPGLGEMI